MTRTSNILANGTPVLENVGSFRYLIIRSATASFQFSTDNSNWRAARLNDSFDFPSLPDKIYLRALDGLASAVTFEYSNTPLTAQSTSQMVASTYIKATPHTMAPGDDLNIPTGDNGHSRKGIVFSVDAGNVAILDSGSNIFCYIVPGAPLYFETDAAFKAHCYIAATLSVGEIYFNS